MSDDVLRMPVTRRFALIELVETDDPYSGKSYVVRTNIDYRTPAADVDRAVVMLRLATDAWAEFYRCPSSERLT